MNRRRPRRWYISCRQVKKNEYQKELLSRHNVIFAKTADEAELVLLPQDRGGMTPQQKIDLERAIDLGINCWIIPIELIYDQEASDSLEQELLGTGSDMYASADEESEEEESLELAL